MQLESDQLAVVIDQRSGALASVVVKAFDADLIGELRLLANFRLCLPLADYQCNYIDGMQQEPATVTRCGDTVTVGFTDLRSEKGTYRVDLTYTITLAADQLRFRARLTNHSPHPISEFWFPRLGGWTRFGRVRGRGRGRDARVAVPDYTGCAHRVSLFKEFPCAQRFGEAAEWFRDYPSMVMPWMDVYDAATDTGLYLGYHDTTFRYSSWHTYLYPMTSGRDDRWLQPEEAGGLPTGLIFSHVRYPFIQDGQTLDSGEFIMRVHPGDWHRGSKFYGEWFRSQFPISKTRSWLRQKGVWFSSILHQPEDRIQTDYQGFAQWCREARQFGIDTCEVVGWDKGGLERDYPEYVPEDKLGGSAGFRKLLASINAAGGKCLVFVNYNFLDQNTDWYKRELHQYCQQDQFGKQPVYGWGESTFLARKGVSVRRHVLASVIPPMERLLEEQFVQLVKDGAAGLQIDKINMGSTLDFNPLNTEKPDVAMCEGMVQAIARLLAKCRAINPEFCLAAEAVQDRLLPYVDVYYRNAEGSDIAPLRYVFPEWTACQHVADPYDCRGVNGAILTGAVICVEPFAYQGSLGHPLYAQLARYIQEVQRIREELADTIFLGTYYDTLEAEVTLIEDDAPANPLQFRVHGHRETDRRAIVVANTTEQPADYRWRFAHREVRTAVLHVPFSATRTVAADDPLAIEGEALHVLVEV